MVDHNNVRARVVWLTKIDIAGHRHPTPQHRQVGVPRTTYILICTANTTPHNFPNIVLHTPTPFVFLDYIYFYFATEHPPGRSPKSFLTRITIYAI
jgi:hypothetical protein